MKRCLNCRAVMIEPRRAWAADEVYHICIWCKGFENFQEVSPCKECNQEGHDNGTRFTEICRKCDRTGWIPSELDVPPDHDGG